MNKLQSFTWLKECSNTPGKSCTADNQCGAGNKCKYKDGEFEATVTFLKARETAAFPSFQRLKCTLILNRRPTLCAVVCVSPSQAVPDGEYELRLRVDCPPLCDAKCSNTGHRCTTNRDCGVGKCNSDYPTTLDAATRMTCGVATPLIAAATRVSAPLAGVLDTRPPAAVPAFHEPADRLWEAGDAISLAFDEELRCHDEAGAPLYGAGTFEMALHAMTAGGNDAKPVRSHCGYGRRNGPFGRACCPLRCAACSTDCNGADPACCVATILASSRECDDSKPSFRDNCVLACPGATVPAAETRTYLMEHHKFRIRGCAAKGAVDATTQVNQFSAASLRECFEKMEASGKCGPYVHVSVDLVLNGKYQCGCCPAGTSAKHMVPDVHFDMYRAVVGSESCVAPARWERGKRLATLARPAVRCSGRTLTFAIPPVSLLGDGLDGGTCRKSGEACAKDADCDSKYKGDTCTPFFQRMLENGRNKLLTLGYGPLSKKTCKKTGAACAKDADCDSKHEGDTCAAPAPVRDAHGNPVAKLASWTFEVAPPNPSQHGVRISGLLLGAVDKLPGGAGGAGGGQARRLAAAEEGGSAAGSAGADPLAELRDEIEQATQALGQVELAVDADGGLRVDVAAGTHAFQAASWDVATRLVALLRKDKDAAARLGEYPQLRALAQRMWEAGGAGGAGGGGAAPQLSADLVVARGAPQHAAMVAARPAAGSDAQANTVVAEMQATLARYRRKEVESDALAEQVRRNTGAVEGARRLDVAAVALGAAAVAALAALAAAGVARLDRLERRLLAAKAGGGGGGGGGGGTAATNGNAAAFRPGMAVDVWWAGERRHYAGTVEGVDAAARTVAVAYDDGDRDGRVPLANVRRRTTPTPAPKKETTEATKPAKGEDPGATAVASVALQIQ